MLWSKIKQGKRIGRVGLEFKEQLGKALGKEMH